MTRTPLLLTTLTALALAACEPGGNTIVQNGPADPMANEVANAAPIELPAPIVASKKYRCADNTVVSLDWREKDQQPTAANLRVADATLPNELKLGAEGKPPYTGTDGTELTGTKEASSVQLKLPGKDSQTCKA
jgi:hypothetical protein